VPGLAAGKESRGEAFGVGSWSVLLRTDVSSTLLLVAEASSSQAAVAASTEIASILVMPRTEAPSHHVALSILRPLERSVKVIPISHSSSLIPISHSSSLLP
jgi:hypothetical protein